MMKSTWAKLFKDYNEAMIFTVELEYQRRGSYEEPYVWDGIIEKMNKLNNEDMPDAKKINILMTTISKQLLLPQDIFPRSWLIKKIPELKNMLKYYKKNPEEIR
tara:strand:+ start:1208 stop:1519 length:312 start_codon:yes stop_codon:yes gene_type:complete